MNETLLFIISLIKSAFDGTKVEIADGVSLEEVYGISKKYQLLPLVYSGAANSGMDFPDVLSQKADNLLLQNFMYDCKQSKVLSSLTSLFEANGLDYMPVKGMLLKKMYPSAELRPMGDGDVLIRTEQYGKIAELLKDNEYTFRCESAHEYVYNKDGVCIELHKHLIPPYNKDYHSYYGNGWNLATPDEGTRYKLSDNDHYIYLFTHFAKHYRDGGVGPIHIVDLWVLAKERSLDFDYISAELRKLRLDRFHENVLATVNAWFNGGEHTDITYFITSRVFRYGNFGTRETRSVAAATKASKSTSVKGLAFKKGMKSLFPKVEDMQFRYPVLKKHRYLLAACWVHRIFDTVIFKQNRLKARLDEAKLATSKNVEKYQNELDLVGLDFNFKD